jgi:glutamate formiminotransferase/formiminotetrahydrofolate cyclodeaminase
LTFLVDEDTNAFNKIMNAFSMPKGNDSEKKMREDAIQSATQYATEIPLKTMKVAYSAFDLLEAMIKDGTPNSVSDAGVGALAVRSAVYGAYMNVLINSADLKDTSVAERLTGEAREVLDLSLERERELVDYVIQVLKSRK